MIEQTSVFLFVCISVCRKTAKAIVEILSTPFIHSPPTVAIFGTKC